MTDDEKRQKDAFEFLSSKFPAHYRVKTTTYLKGILEAIAEGDGYIESQVEAVRDNLMVVTASGKHLDRLAAQYGVVREQGAGILDDDFRKLVPVLGMSPKQITHTIQQIIDLIYGPYASHANVSCSAPQPYNMNDGSRLRILLDGEEVEIEFLLADAVDLSAMTADEVADAITNKSNGRIQASVVENVRTSEQFVNIRTSTIGSQGFIQVLGGDAQRALRFPEVRETLQNLSTYSVDRYLGTDEMVYSVTSGLGPAARSAGVERGDYLTIRIDSGFAEQNCGTFLVTYVDEYEFRVRNGRGIAEASVTNLNIDDFCFFKPNMGNILLAARPATVIQTDSKELTVLLPVTSPIIKRTLKGGHHFHGGISNVLSATSDTVTLGSIEGFDIVDLDETSGSVRLISSRIKNEGTVSTVGATSITLVSAEGWPDRGAVYAANTDTWYYYDGKTDETLNNVYPAPPADIIGVPVRYDQRFMYTGVTGTTLTGVYPDPSATVGFELTARIELEDEFIGAFLYWNDAPFVASSIETKLAVESKIEQGSSNTILKLVDNKDFPKTGYVVLEYATREQEGPIKYFGKVGTESLIIDPGHVFNRDHFKGASVRFVKELGAYIPRTNGDDYAAYLTGTGIARRLLAEYLRAVIAAGVVLRFEIQVPDYKWKVLPLLYANDPHDTSLQED